MQDVERINRYDGVIFSDSDGSRFRVSVGVTNRVLHSVSENGVRGLTNPDELEELLLAGLLRVACPGGRIVEAQR